MKREKKLAQKKEEEETHSHLSSVADDFSHPGMACPGCGMPHFSQSPLLEGKKSCASCGDELTQVSDVVHHIVEEAVRQNAVIRCIHGTNLIGSLENIASIVKFKKSEYLEIEEAVETESSCLASNGGSS